MGSRQPDRLPASNAGPLRVSESDSSDPAEGGHTPHPGPRGKPLRDSLWYITVAWLFGSIWFSVVNSVPLTAFGKSLGLTPMQWGIVNAAPYIAALFQIPASLMIERTGLRKRIFMIGLYAMRFVVVPLVAVPVAMVHFGGPSALPLAGFVFVALLLLVWTGQAWGGPAWMSWMADIVPGRVRGKYFGRRRAWGIVSGVPTALVASWVLYRFTSPDQPTQLMYWSAALILAVVIFGIIDIALFHPVPDVPKKPRLDSSLATVLLPPLRDRHFMLFAAFVGVMMFSVTLTGQFTVLYLLEQFSAQAGGGVLSVQLMATCIPMVAQLFVVSLYGRIVDKMGKKPLLAITGLSLVPVGLAWVLVMPQTMWVGFVMAALGAMLWSGVEIANFNLMLEFSASKGGGSTNAGSGYIAINSLVINVGGLLGGITAGLVAQHLKATGFTLNVGFKILSYYDVLFIASAAIRLLAIAVFVPLIHEPRARSVLQTLRFAVTTSRASVVGLATFPMRIVRARREELPTDSQI